MEFNIENQENILLNDLFKAISDILNSSKKTNEKQKRIYPESSEDNFFFGLYPLPIAPIAL